MPLPNFIIFGAIKSGTGALYQYLTHHPEIYMSAEKEPRYFTNVKWKGKANTEKSSVILNDGLDEYLQYFRGVQGEKAIGEASSNYMNSSIAALRIKETIPDVKLIASLRDPVDRAYAHFQMVSKVGKSADFNGMSLGRGQSWATTSLYYEQLKHYYKVFDPKQIKILIFEHWTRNVSSTLEDVYNFLEVESDFKIPAKIEYSPAEVAWPRLHKRSMLRRLKPFIPTLLLLKMNKLKRQLSYRWPPLPDELDREMRKWYRDDILKLQSLINVDLAIWLR